jgi:hypothetical protein
MAISLQNLRSVTPGVKPSALLGGQLCFNVADQVLFVGDGSATQRDFTGASVPCAAEAGWYSMPMSQSGFNQFFLANPASYGDLPDNGDTLAWNSTTGKLEWVPGGGSSGFGVYYTTNSAVASASGVTLTQKINAAIGVTPVTGDTVVVTGLPGDQYQGLYFSVASVWEFAASYAFPTASQVVYDNTLTGIPSNDVQGAIDFVADSKLDNPPVAPATGQILSFNGASNVWIDQTVDYPTAEQVSYNNALSGISATNVQDAIDEVDSLANAAQTSAETASDEAAVALSAANAAQSAAVSAQTTADQAQNTANTAQTLALTAEQRSIQAIGDAAAANTTAAEASTVADEALALAQAAGGESSEAYTLASAALPRSGGVMTGNVTWNVSQTFPVSGIQPATTTQTGVVSLTNSISSTSTDTAATPASVKTTYDLATTANTTASDALPKSGGTMSGNIDFNSGQPIDAGIF